MKIGPADPEILRIRANKSTATQNWLPWQRPLRNRKKTGPDREYSRNCFPFGEEIVKIGAVDPEVALLMLKKKKLMQAKYIALPASLPSRLKNWCFSGTNLLC